MAAWTWMFMLLAMAAGCDRPPADRKAAERLREAIAAETGDTNTVLFVENGKIQIRSGNQRLVLDQTGSRKRPEGLPGDIILPTDARYDLWTEGPRGSTLSLRTGLPPDRLLDFLRAQWPAAGWQETSTVQAENVWSLTFVHGDSQATFTIESEFEPAPATRALLFIETAPGEPAP